MKLYTNCVKCSNEISFWTLKQDRTELKKENGDFVLLTCKICKHAAKYPIDGIIAKRSKVAIVIALTVFVVGTPILFFLLGDYIFRVGNVYSIFGLVTLLTVPGLVYGIIKKNDLSRVRLFNGS